VRLISVAVYCAFFDAISASRASSPGKLKRFLEFPVILPAADGLELGIFSFIYQDGSCYDR
jgi:hypothetical protein